VRTDRTTHIKIDDSTECTAPGGTPAATLTYLGGVGDGDVDADTDHGVAGKDLDHALILLLDGPTAGTHAEESR
jgi:hypothetical protein